MPEEEVANLSVLEGAPQQEVDKLAVEVVLVLEGLRQLQHVQQQVVVTEGSK